MPETLEFTMTDLRLIRDKILEDDDITEEEEHRLSAIAEALDGVNQSEDGVVVTFKPDTEEKTED